MISDKFQNKYRISSARLPQWDYGWSGAYFVTVCTLNREHYFGEITNDIMNLSPIGVIADILWHEITNHNDNVELGAFVVMPNHIHGILVLGGKNVPVMDNVTVETRHALSLQSPAQKRFRNQGKNTVSSIVGGYKSAVTKHARRLGYRFAWQSRFHDHVIRDEQSYQRINDYIITNPQKWDDDTLK